MLILVFTSWSLFYFYYKFLKIFQTLYVFYDKIIYQKPFRFQLALP